MKISQWLITTGVCLALVSCGVPTQDVAQPLASELVAKPEVSSTPTPSASPTPTQSESPVNEVPVDLWFSSEDGLTPISTPITAPVSAQAVVAGLVSGPPVASDLRTVVVDPLTGNPLVSVYEGQLSPEAMFASVNIAVAPEFASLPPNEQVLVLGQVVISVSGASLGTVAFVDSTGSPVAVPLPDGRLLDTPATASDYLDLAATKN